MQGLGILVPVGGPNTKSLAGTNMKPGQKQQWCYLCDASHAYHEELGEYT